MARAFLLTACLLLPVHALFAQAARRTFDVPAGDAASTLPKAAQQAGAEIVFPANVVVGVKTPALKGEYSVAAAFELLLAGSDLVAIIDPATGAVAIQRKESKPKKAVVPESRGASRAPQTPDSADASTVVLDQYVVSGTTLSLRRAIAEKRGEEVIADVISADEIGSIPDFGLGEALERLPGVSMIINNGRGESQFATLRGLNSDYNSIYIDGMHLPSTEASRRNVSLDIIPSSLAKGISYYKTYTPDTGGDAIGGVVNLRTRSAFDNSGFYLSARGNYGYYENRRNFKRFTPSGQFELTTSDIFGKRDQHGLVVSASIFRRDSSTILASTDTFTFWDATGAQYSTAIGNSTGATPVPSRRSWYSYDNVRARYGLFAKYEYRPISTATLHVTSGFFQHTNDEQRIFNTLIRNTGTAGKPAITGPTTGIVNSANAEVNRYDYFQDRRIMYGEIGFKAEPSPDREFSAAVNYGVGNYRQDADDDIFRASNSASLAYTFQTNFGAPVQFTPLNPAYYYNPANYRHYEHAWYDYESNEQVISLDSHYGYNATPDARGWGYKGGASYRFMDRTYDYRITRYRPTAKTLTLADALDARTIYPYSDPDTYLLNVDMDKARKMFAANPSLYPLYSGNLGDNLEADYDLTEGVASAYAMGSYRTDRFVGLAGVRWEQTRLETGSWATKSSDAGTYYVWEKQRSHYDSVLPSINLSYNVTNKLRLRAAASRSISRPAFGDLASRTVVNDQSSDGYITISKGNPDLKPRESDNFDLSAEWYFSKDSMISAAVCRKNVSNEIVSVTSKSAATVDGVDVITSTTTPRNLDDARIDGLELGFTDTKLDFLPRALRGFGIGANVTWLNIDTSTIEMDDGTRRKLPSLLESCKYTLNITLMYEYKRWSAQVSYKHTDPMLWAIDTSDAFEDRFYRANDVYDAQIRYRFNRRWSFTLQAKNLTNNRPTRVLGYNQEYNREELDNGRSWFIGATYSFR
ncbi:hypothetical protein DB354_13055 [Opitutus sp. ER46]|nr:hypothetical protein DB354_13055 [Opitutus sp. ER46]